MRTERERCVLRTRARDEERRHSAHRLNRRCIDYCGSMEADFVPALVTPAAMVNERDGEDRLAFSLARLPPPLLTQGDSELGSGT